MKNKRKERESASESLLVSLSPSSSFFKLESRASIKGYTNNVRWVFSPYPRRLFPFRKRSLPFLTVDAIIGNQAFCHGRCNICSGLSHNKVTNTFLNSLRKNKV